MPDSKKLQPKSAIAKYEVTVSPQIEIDYTVEVEAKNDKQAIRIARKDARKNIQHDLRELASLKTARICGATFSTSKAGTKVVNGELREYDYSQVSAEEYHSI